VNISATVVYIHFSASEQRMDSQREELVVFRRARGYLPVLEFVE
jgi:hypothetical protein